MATSCHENTQPSPWKGAMELLEIFPLRVQGSLTGLRFLETPDDEAATRFLFDFLDKKGISIAFLIEAPGEGGNRDIILAVNHIPESSFHRELDQLRDLLKAKAVVVDEKLAVVRILGPHFDIRPGVAAIVLGHLLRAKIRVLAHAVTLTSCLLLMEESQVEDAVVLLQRIFRVPRRL
jgi:aspartokinase